MHYNRFETKCFRSVKSQTLSELTDPTWNSIIPRRWESCNRAGSCTGIPEVGIPSCLRPNEADPPPSDRDCATEIDVIPCAADL